MRWTEIIVLRSGSGDLRALDTNQLFEIRDNYQTGRLKDLKVYRHGSMETDLSVHLHWETDRIDRTGSSLAQHMIQFLKEYGLVNHSVWKEAA